MNLRSYKSTGHFTYQLLDETNIDLFTPLRVVFTYNTYISIIVSN